MTSHIPSIWRPPGDTGTQQQPPAFFQKEGWPSSGSHPHRVLGSRSDPSQSLHYATSSGPLTVILPREGLKFKSPWGRKQVLFTLTSQLATKPSYSILSSHPNMTRSLSPLRHAQEYICQPKRQVAWQDGVVINPPDLGVKPTSTI